MSSCVFEYTYFIEKCGKYGMKINKETAANQIFEPAPKKFIFKIMIVIFSFHPFQFIHV